MKGHLFNLKWWSDLLMGAVRKSTREGEEVFSREVGYGAQEAGGGLEFVCEVQSRGCSWCNVTGRTSGTLGSPLLWWLWYQQPCIKSTPLVRSFRDGRCNSMGAFAYEKWLLNEFFICVFLWHPCFEEGYESHKASNGSESSLKLKLSLCTYLRRFFPSSFYSLDNVIIEQPYK